LVIVQRRAMVDSVVELGHWLSSYNSVCFAAHTDGIGDETVSEIAAPVTVHVTG
jgi:hypothetical protein